MDDRTAPRSLASSALNGIRALISRPGRDASGRADDERTTGRPLAAGVVLAGGSGARFGADQNKAYLPLAGRSLASWGLRALAAAADVGPLVLVVRPADHEIAEQIVRREVDGAPVEIVFGGATRQESELHALRHLARRIDAAEVDVIAIHDAARPLAPSTLIAGVIHAARAHGGAIPAIPAEDLVEVREDGTVNRTAHGGLVRAQTPQAFAAAPLLAAYEEAARTDFVGTDTSSCLEEFSTIKVRWIMGETQNLKITHPRDLFLAESILAAVGYHLP